MQKSKTRKCKKCKLELNFKNAYKYSGYLYALCKKCRNAYGRKIYRKNAKALKDSKWF